MDRYEVHEELGRGGMSVVYRGLDTTLQRRVAIKVLVPGVCGFAVPQRRVDVGLGVERRADARREEGVEANVVGARALARDGARRRRRDEILAHGGDRGEVGGPEVLRPGVQDAVPNGAKAVGLVALSVGIVVGRLCVPEHEVVLSARDVDGELDLFGRGGGGEFVSDGHNGRIGRGDSINHAFGGSDCGPRTLSPLRTPSSALITLALATY